MDNKILTFLKSAGYDVSDDSPPVIQLLRYFEDEFGISIMPFLEQEWVDEQVETQLDAGGIAAIRDFLDDQFYGEFDEVLEEIGW